MNLWEFSLSLYAKPGVPDACLTLQNNHRLDVNLVLFCLWLAADGRCLSEADVREAVAKSDAWRCKMISPLRALRTDMKAWPSEERVAEFSRREDFEELRDKVKAIELEAEHWQQQVLSSLADRGKTSKDPHLLGFAASLALLFERSEAASSFSDYTTDDNALAIECSAQSPSDERNWVQPILRIAKAQDEGFAARVRSALLTPH